MSGITPVSSVTPNVAAVQAGEAKEGVASGFSQLLGQCMQRVESDQQGAHAAVQSLLTGESQDVLSVVAEVSKADMSFKLLMAVRNKVIEAYKQTMNMQI